jgi:hypothetical protein
MFPSLRLGPGALLRPGQLILLLRVHEPDPDLALDRAFAAVLERLQRLAVTAIKDGSGAGILALIAGSFLALDAAQAQQSGSTI